jgi:Leu/Phe-tRNA-protein transferase
VGGFWGLSVGRVFAIMSMFHLERSAGSLALAALTDSLTHGGRWSIIDCGGPGYHWDRYGARNFSVKRFSALVTRQLLDPGDVDGISNWTQSEPTPMHPSPAECAIARSSFEV